MERVAIRYVRKWLTGPLAGVSEINVGTVEGRKFGGVYDTFVKAIETKHAYDRGEDGVFIFTHVEALARAA